VTFVVLALFGNTLVGIVRVVIALVGIAPVGIGTCTRGPTPHIARHQLLVITGAIQVRIH